MLEKYFVPYDRVLKLKELGFDSDYILKYYNPIDGAKSTLYDPNRVTRSKFLPAPLFAQAFDWFRENYWFDYSIKPTKVNEFKKYSFNIFEEVEDIFPTSRENSKYFNTIEEAELACLDKLIEIAEKLNNIENVYVSDKKAIELYKKINKMKIRRCELKEKFENPLGLEFYTFYLESSKRGTRFNIDTGIFKVSPYKKSSKRYEDYEYKIIEVFKENRKTGGKHLNHFVDNSHARSIGFLYTNYDDAVKDYDKRVRGVLENPQCNSSEVKLLEKMLINKITEIEIATLWYNSLESLHKNYLELLGFKIK